MVRVGNVSHELTKEDPEDDRSSYYDRFYGQVMENVDNLEFLLDRSLIATSRGGPLELDDGTRITDPQTIKDFIEATESRCKSWSIAHSPRVPREWTEHSKPRVFWGYSEEDDDFFCKAIGRKREEHLDLATKTEAALEDLNGRRDKHILSQNQIAMEKIMAETYGIAERSVAWEYVKGTEHFDAIFWAETRRFDYM